MATDVRRNDAESRYEIIVDGELAGIADYADLDGKRVAHHTEVFDAFTGRGLATALVAGALDDIRATGLRVVPVCPVFAAFLRRHPDRADIADPVHPELLRRLGAALGAGA
ncbi:GNAT family N-acetyltransferase [Saccharothrix sp. Mg75]|uniref:GNAT family N-acetyltransferase n=1 Tax=Saccharothrix sp. Mg75 TaxID=3445357 RepID=UPI003EEC2B62